jgi:hypothetical protein
MVRFMFRIARVGASNSAAAGTIEIVDADNGPFVESISIVSTTSTTTIIQLSLSEVSSATGMTAQGVLLLQEHNNVATTGAWS